MYFHGGKFGLAFVYHEFMGEVMRCNKIALLLLSERLGKQLCYGLVSC